MPRLIWSEPALANIRRLHRFDGEQVTILAVRHQKEAGF